MQEGGSDSRFGNTSWLGETAVVTGAEAARPRVCIGDMLRAGPEAQEDTEDASDDEDDEGKPEVASGRSPGATLSDSLRGDAMSDSGCAVF